MARPAIVNRAMIAEAALKIIDDEGLDALNQIALARSLGIRPSTMYYHFEDKAEILAEVTRNVLLETEVPLLLKDGDWVEWFVELSRGLRRTILRHPNTAPLLLQYYPMQLTIPQY